jgi:plastocyanin
MIRKSDFGFVAAVFIAAIACGAGMAWAAGEAHVVGQKGSRFSTDTLTMRAGTSVRFDNDDTIAHNITVRGPSSGSGNLGVMRPGAALSVAFDKPGDHQVLCQIHPRMKLSVKVE